jgi:hypothetical protein
MTTSLGAWRTLRRALARDDLPPEVRGLLTSTFNLLAAIAYGWDALDDDLVLAWQDGKYVRRAAKLRPGQEF